MTISAVILIVAPYVFGLFIMAGTIFVALPIRRPVSRRFTSAEKREMRR